MKSLFYLNFTSGQKNNGSELGENCPAAVSEQVMAKVIQAIAANKLTVGDRVLVLISGSVPSELRYLRHFKEEGECHRLELDPGLPIESFHALQGIWTKGQEDCHSNPFQSHDNSFSKRNSDHNAGTPLEPNSLHADSVH